MPENKQEQLQVQEFVPMDLPPSEEPMVVLKISIVDYVYTVQKGDSLWDIANRNNVTLDEILEANPQFSSEEGRNPDLIYPGEIVHIPKDNGEKTDGVLVQGKGKEDSLCTQCSDEKSCKEACEEFMRKNGAAYAMFVRHPLFPGAQLITPPVGRAIGGSIGKILGGPVGGFVLEKIGHKIGPPLLDKGLDSLNIELAHEHIFVYNNKGEVVGNIGYGADSKRFCYSKEEMEKGYANNNKHDRTDDFKPIDSKHYDPAKICEALSKVTDGKYGGMRDNCQGWTARVREEYKKAGGKTREVPTPGAGDYGRNAQGSERAIDFLKEEIQKKIEQVEQTVEQTKDYVQDQLKKLRETVQKNVEQTKDYVEDQLDQFQDWTSKNVIDPIVDKYNEGRQNAIKKYNEVEFDGQYGGSGEFDGRMKEGGTKKLEGGLGVKTEGAWLNDGNSDIGYYQGKATLGYSKDDKETVYGLSADGQFSIYKYENKSDQTKILTGNASVEVGTVKVNVTPIAVVQSKPFTGIKSEIGAEATVSQVEVGGNINITPKTIYDNLIRPIGGLFKQNWDKAPDYLDHGVYLYGGAGVGYGAAAKAKVQVGKTSKGIGIGTEVKAGLGWFGSLKGGFGIK